MAYFFVHQKSISFRNFVYTEYAHVTRKKKEQNEAKKKKVRDRYLSTTTGIDRYIDR